MCIYTVYNNINGANRVCAIEYTHSVIVRRAHAAPSDTRQPTKTHRIAAAAAAAAAARSSGPVAGWTHCSCARAYSLHI